MTGSTRLSSWYVRAATTSRNRGLERHLKSPRECPLAVTNTTIDGVEAYATNDLVVPHPQRPGYWKLIGRRDDQIVLANGEKVGRKLHARLVSELTRILRWQHRPIRCLSVGFSAFHCGGCCSTHSIPLAREERIINEDPRIQDCIVFGNGRAQNGVLVQPTAQYSFDPQHQDALANFRKEIW